jgi:hypothetical protein
MPPSLHHLVIEKNNKKLIPQLSHNMANSKCLFLQIPLFILLLSLSPSSAHNQSSKSMAPPPASQVDYKGCFSKVYAFGDSYTDTGNAHFMGALKSYISVFFNMFKHGSSSAGNLPGYRLSNGRLVIDYLCETLSVPHLPAYKDSSAQFSGGVNFAIAGSTTLSVDFFAQFRIDHSLMWKRIPESYRTQIDWFHKFLAEFDCKGKDEATCKGELANTLIWVGEMGGNDYARLYGSSIHGKHVTEQAVGNVCGMLRVSIDTTCIYFSSIYIYITLTRKNLSCKISIFSLTAGGVGQGSKVCRGSRATTSRVPSIARVILSHE